MNESELSYTDAAAADALNYSSIPEFDSEKTEEV